MHVFLGCIPVQRSMRYIHPTQTGVHVASFLCTQCACDACSRVSVPIEPRTVEVAAPTVLTLNAEVFGGSLGA